MRHSSLSLILLIPLWLGCGRKAAPPEPLTILMINNTGDPMNDFMLDTGSGPITYQIFSKDYHFRETRTITSESPLRLKYRTSGGQEISRMLDWTVKPEHNGGWLEVTFEEGGRATFKFRPLANPQPKETAGENIADARRWFDAIPVGQDAQKTGEIMGMTPKQIHKHGFAKDFGRSFKPECVTLQVGFIDGKVARVEIVFPYDGPRKGEIVAEAGLSKKEYDALPEE